MVAHVVYQNLFENGQCVKNIQRDQKVSVRDDYTTQLMIWRWPSQHIRNVDRAILNTVFENTVRHVNKCLETGGRHFEHYLLLSVL
jgi:hypothetical protein